MNVLLSQTAPTETEAALLSRGYRVLRLPPHPALPAPVASHPDMLLCALGGSLFAPAEYLSWGKTVGLQLTPIPEALQPDYPGDIRLNALTVGSHLFAHRAISAALLRCAAVSGMNVHFVRQGYAHCGALTIGGHSVITADASLARSATDAGIEVLTLPQGEILLPGYSYHGLGGLCGGSGGTDERTRTVFLCGTPPAATHARLSSFCGQRGYTVLCLPAPQWTDIGGILFL